MSILIITSFKLISKLGSLNLNNNSKSIEKEITELVNEDLENQKMKKIGNIVSQLHIHVIARSKKDSSWPLSV